MNVPVNSGEQASDTVVTSQSDVTVESTEPQISASAESKPADETTEDSETSEGTGESDETETLEAGEGEEAGDQPKKKGGFQRKIDKLNREKSEAALKAEKAERDAEFWKAKAIGSQPAETEAVVEPTVEASGKPNVDDFETQSAYLEALVDWKADQKLAEKENQAKSLAEKSAREARAQELRTAATEFAKSHPNYNEVLQSVDDIPMSLVVQDALMENGPEFAFEIAQNREEFERLNGLSAVKALKEIGKIEQRLALRKEKPVEIKTTTKAPPPIASVKGASAGAKKSLDEMDYDEFKKARQEQISAR